MPQALPAIIAALLLLIGALGLALQYGGNHALLWGLGAALGYTLYRGSFSFAGGFREVLADGRGAGLRAQMLMLSILVTVMLPAIQAGTLAGAPVRGIVFPAGVAVVIGAFIFGIGMQLGGGCASGTLYTAGGGNTRMLLTLIFFITGATIAAYDAERWADLPALSATTLPELIGLWPALLGSLAIFLLVALGSRVIEQRRHGRIEPILSAPSPNASRRWSWAMAAIILAALNILTLWAAGRPWVITASFPLWGSRIIAEFGWDEPAFWAFWEDPTRTEAFLRPVLAERSSVMNFGLMLGAFFAAAIAARFSPTWRLPWRHVCASVIGGLLLGYGAVMASGCNISAYVAGIASGSLHGWLWILPGIVGNWVGLGLRPLFRLDR
ncbi:MAG: YeeE/YedE family protein [Alphaproteobacteria bacterium]|nr:YeeE/YedE family protein [Alphaproteobacteria bacterium]